MMFLSQVFWRSQACFCLLNTGQLVLNCRFRQNDSFLVDVFNRSIPCCHASIQYNRSQITSKYIVCGKQKKSGARAAGECVTVVGLVSVIMRSDSKNDREYLPFTQTTRVEILSIKKKNYNLTWWENDPLQSTVISLSTDTSLRRTLL